MPAASSASVEPTEFASIDELLDAPDNVHDECGRNVTLAIAFAVQERFAERRCAFAMVPGEGFARDTLTTCTFFGRLAGGASAEASRMQEALAHFGLADHARTRMAKLTRRERILANIARASLAEPEVCFIERPLSDLPADDRALVLAWISERTDAGCRIITAGQPLREALFMPDIACWADEGRFIVAQQDDGAETGDDAPAYDGDEVHVLKIPAKTDAATLLFDPRDIDFAESANKQTYLSVRGELFLTPRTMDELEAELAHAGFFRCHRSYLVNVQKVQKVERYTRNSFNLTLSDAVRSSIPLAKGRADEMRARYGW